jgi:hypothetical protein
MMHGQRNLDRAVLLVKLQMLLLLIISKNDSSPTIAYVAEGEDGARTDLEEALPLALHEGRETEQVVLV